MREVTPVLQEVVTLVMDSLPELQTRRYDITWKSDGSPVTAADTFLEERIFGLLKSRFSDLACIGEETWQAGALATAEWHAVLDPIDGTENFCSGLKEWGTSISLWRSGQHAGSALILPELGEVMFTGNVPRVPRSRIVGFSSSYHDEIGRGLAATDEGRIMGCAVYNLFNVIRGAYARFINPKGARAWDLIAGVAIAHESGCEVIINGEAYNGQFLEPDQRYRVDIRHRHDLHPG